MQIEVVFSILISVVLAKIQEVGKKKKYETDIDFAHKIKYVPAFAFVKKNKVVDAFEILKNSVNFLHESQRVVDYFEKVWIGEAFDECRKQPKYDHGLWNCYDGVLQNLPRTNNYVEGWHRPARNGSGIIPTLCHFWSRNISG